MMLNVVLALLLVINLWGCHGAKTSQRGQAATMKNLKNGKRGMRTKKTPAPTIGVPTYSPTITAIPTLSPTISPSITPYPTVSPSQSPTRSPTRPPTPRPTKEPTLSPTINPTNSPTFNPTISPSVSFLPTVSPTLSPTFPPPTPLPTNQPTNSPTFSPTVTPIPTYSPTITAIPTQSPTGSPTRRKKGNAKNNKGLKQTRIFQTRAMPISEPPSSPPTSSGTFSPTMTPTASFLPTLPPSSAVVLAKRGKKGKRPQAGGTKGAKQRERSLQKGKGTTTRRKKHVRAATQSSAPVATATKTTGKGKVTKHRRKQNTNSGPKTQAKQARIASPSSVPVGKATLAPKGTKKSAGPKGTSKGVTSPPIATTSTIEFRSADKKGPPQVIPYDPTGKKIGPFGKTAGAISSKSSNSPSAVPSSPPKLSSGSTQSKVPTSGASQAGVNSKVFATVELPKFSFKFTVVGTSAQPTEQDYKDLSVITAILVDSEFFDYFQGDNNTQYYSTNIESFTPSSAFNVEFKVACKFLKPSVTPTPGQLATILSEKFNGLSFVALLKRLAASNVFSLTSNVVLEVDPSVLEPLPPTTAAATSSSTNVNTKVIAPVAAAAGALVAILAAAALCYRSRRRSVANEETLNKKPPAETPEDGTVEGSCYNSVVSRSTRNNGKNGTAEFGDTAGDYDDCATQASGSYSTTTPLPTIGESDDEVASVQQQPQGNRSRDVSSPCTTDEMSLSEVPLFEESDGEL